METNAFKNQETRKLRLRPLSINDLPAHPLIPSPPAPQPELSSFALEVLREAVDFSDTVIPEIFAKKGAPKESAPSAAKVQLFSSDLIAGESWFARHSLHQDQPVRGTASYAEFEGYLLDDHSVHEGQYTPEVLDARKVMEWADGVPIPQLEEFSDVVVEAYEMCHKIPSPVNNRAFPVLVVRAKTPPKGFVIAQIPIDFPKSFKEAFYSSGRSKTEGNSKETRGNIIIGHYVSVERVKMHNAEVSWETATASDARGWVPMGLQKLGVPGAVLKDVGLFMDWTDKQRNKTAATA